MVCENELVLRMYWCKSQKIHMLHQSHSYKTMGEFAPYPNIPSLIDSISETELFNDVIFQKT